MREDVEGHTVDNEVGDLIFEVPVSLVGGDRICETLGVVDRVSPASCLKSSRI